MKTSQSFYVRHLSTISTLSIAVAGLMTALSLAGLLFSMMTYFNEELRQSFIANDVVNLVIGLPVLLGALWLRRRAKLPRLLGLPGAWFYVTYNSIAYATAMPLTLHFFAHLALAILSVAAIFLIISSVDGATVQARLQGRMSEWFGAGVLIGLGTLFFLRAVAEFGVLVADGLNVILF